MRRSALPLALALRVFLFALLALGMLLKPMLESMGEIHELAHDPVASQASANFGEDAADASHAIGLQTGGDQREGAEDPLHALDHIAHCCCPSSLTSSPIALATATPASTERPHLQASQVVPQALRIAPFRPPITA